jgi:hypothetical protein
MCKSAPTKWVVEQNLKTDVAAGENGGRTPKHTNVVRALGTHALTAGDAAGQVTLTLPAEVVLKNVSVVGSVQDEKTLWTSGASAVKAVRRTMAVGTAWFSRCDRSSRRGCRRGR